MTPFPSLIDPPSAVPPRWRPDVERLPGTRADLARAAAPRERSTHRILVIDDESPVRSLCSLLLQAEGYSCDEAVDGPNGLEAVRRQAYDLVLLDIDMPHMSGVEVLRRLREADFPAHLKVLLFSGRVCADEMAHLLGLGADDFLSKPFSSAQLLGRVRAALRVKESQDRSAATHHRLEQDLTARERELLVSRETLVLALTELVANRDVETGAHLLRVRRYCGCLAEEVAAVPGFGGGVSADYVRLLECCAPLHDIGKVGVPDEVLLKPGRLDARERVVVQTHTVIGSEILRKAAACQNGFADFFRMAIDITRHHHERVDGTGYPDGLAGDAIPLSARLLALADVYDALRSRRTYKPAMAHDAVVATMTRDFGSHFDARLAPVFLRCAPRLDTIFRELPG